MFVYSVLISLFRVKNRGEVIIIYSVLPLRLIFNEQDIRSNYFSKHIVILYYPKRAKYGLISLNNLFIYIRFLILA